MTEMNKQLVPQEPGNPLLGGRSYAIIYHEKKHLGFIPRIRARMEMWNGQPDGKVTYYHENGRVWMTGEYKQHGNDLSAPVGVSMVGHWEIFYDNGKVQGVVNFDDHGNYHMGYVENFRDGTPLALGSYKHGQPLPNTWLIYDPKHKGLMPYAGDLRKLDEYKNRVFKDWGGYHVK